MGVETDGWDSGGPQGPLPEGAWTAQGRDRLAVSPVEVEVGRVNLWPSSENVFNLNEEDC